jgi:hypothetical protein
MRLLRASLTVLTVFGSLLLLHPAVHADSLSLSLAEPVQSVPPTGAMLDFTATVSAPLSNTGAIFLNSDSFNLAGPLSLDDSPFFLNFPLSLNPGQSDTDVLFTVTVPANTVGTFPGSFSILGGSTDTASNVPATASFQITETPEPESFVLLGTGLASLIVSQRHRLRRT